MLNIQNISLEVLKASKAHTLNKPEVRRPLIEFINKNARAI